MSEQIASAVQHARSAFDARIDRLRALARHNRAIDPDQIDRLEASREQLANTLAQARPRLDALRLVGSPDFVSLRGVSAARRVGKGCVSTCRSRWSPPHYKKICNNTTQT